MKSLFSIVVMSLLALTVPVFAQTNTPTTLEQVKNTATAVVSTNLNQVLIEMLSGVKDASGEIYGASKQAIHKSVDFIAEQAPDVIKQFLMWRLFRALTWASIFTFIAGVCLFFSYKLKKYQSKASTESYGDPSEHQVTTLFKWILAVVACLFITFGVGANAFEIVKIKVAPKVYIIEYVIDTIQGHQNTNHR